MFYTVISYTFLQIYDNIFILRIKFYDLLHGQSVCLDRIENQQVVEYVIQVK